jgi:hypothetical protein
MALNFLDGPANRHSTALVFKTECLSDETFSGGAANPGRRRVSTRRQAGWKAGCRLKVCPTKPGESIACQMGWENRLQSVQAGMAIS